MQVTFHRSDRRQSHSLLLEEQNLCSIDFVEYACLIHVAALQWSQIPPHKKLGKTVISQRHESSCTAPGSETATFIFNVQSMSFGIHS